MGANADEVAGKAVIIQRGGCQFLEKTMKGWASNASMVIIVNSETSINRYGCEPRWKGLKVDIPAIMVTDKTGETLSAMAKGDGEGGKKSRIRGVPECAEGGVA